MNAFRANITADKHVSKCLGACKMDLWEADYVVGGDKMKANAKRASKRACRRASRAVIAEQQKDA